MPPNAISYSESQFDLPAFYAVLKRGLAAMSPGQNPAMMVEMMAQQKLGMPIADALTLPTGEFTSMQLSPALDPDKSIYVFGIHKKAETLKLMRTLLGEQIISERTEGDTTFLKISLNAKQNTKGVASWNFYHLGVTPNFIYGAPKFESVKEAIAGRDTMHTMVVTPFQEARADYPAKINGLYFFDFSKVDWAAAKARWIEEAKKSAEKPTATADQKAAAAKIPHILADANPANLPAPPPHHGRRLLERRKRHPLRPMAPIRQFRYSCRRFCRGGLAPPAHVSQPPMTPPCSRDRFPDRGV